MHEGPCYIFVNAKTLHSGGVSSHHMSHDSLQEKDKVYSLLVRGSSLFMEGGAKYLGK